MNLWARDVKMGPTEIKKESLLINDRAKSQTSLKICWSVYTVVTSDCENQYT